MLQRAPHPLSIFAVLWRHFPLALRLTRREIQAEFQGTAMGRLWIVLQPTLMLGIYWFVFKYVLKARWDVGTADAPNSSFVLILFCGLIVFWLFADCVTRAPRLFLENVAYIKKVVFPLEILPWVVVIRALWRAGISFAVLVCAHLVLVGLPPVTILFLPLALLPLCFFCLGLLWLIASLGIFLRDLGPLVQLTVNAVMFLSPVFFPLSSVPEIARPLLMLNPLTPVIEMTRNVVLWGRPPVWSHYAVLLALSLASAWLGLVWFTKTNRGFADVV